jgi:hypothetical protein
MRPGSFCDGAAPCWGRGMKIQTVGNIYRLVWKAIAKKRPLRGDLQDVISMGSQ